MADKMPFFCLHKRGDALGFYKIRFTTLIRFGQHPC